MKQMRRIIALALTAALLCVCGVSALASDNGSATYTMPYYIEVDIANQMTTVYSTADNSIVRQMICTTGMGDRTPCGTFIMPTKKYDQDRTEWYYFPEFEIYAKYASRIYNGILFHSILFTSKRSAGPTWASNHSLGSKASHGCIRLRVSDAKWIAENCLAGTQVRMFDDGERNEDLRKLLKASTFIASETTYEEFMDGYVCLSRGANLDSVLELQEKLTALGYDCGKIDGDFGSKTEKAVEAWQQDFGYEVTGIVSPYMLKTILACPTPVPTVTPEPTPEPDLSDLKFDTAVVRTQNSLNVRSDPSVNGRLLGTLSGGTTVHVFTNDGGWSSIEYNGAIGYVSSNYINVTATREPDPEPVATPTPEPTPEPTVEPTVEPEAIDEPEDEPLAEETLATVRDMTATLNVRADHSTGAGTLAKLKTGDTVTAIGRNGDWIQVRLADGIVGYVMEKYLIMDASLLPVIEDTIPEGTPAEVTVEDGAELYRAAEENGGLITTLKAGQKVYIREESDDWAWVYARGFVGYLPKASLTVEEEEAA